jgi:hypothetical protein
VPERPKAVHGSGPLRYSLHNVPDKRAPILSFMPEIGLSSEKAARADRIGADLNKNMAQESLWLFAEGGATQLDGMHLRRVVFKGVEVHYSGGPLILENVSFINCVFVFDNNEHGRDLGRTLLASASVDFRTAA